MFSTVLQVQMQPRMTGHQDKRLCMEQAKLSTESSKRLVKEAATLPCEQHDIVQDCACAAFLNAHRTTFQPSDLCSMSQDCPLGLLLMR